MLHAGRHYDEVCNAITSEVCVQMDNKLKSIDTTHLTKANPLLSLENLSRGI